MSASNTASLPVSKAPPGRQLAPWWQALPLTLVFALFFLVPLALILMVSFWDFNQYQMIPDFTFNNYVAVFEGCFETGDMCVTFKTYLSTLKFCFLVWLITLVVGFTVSYFLAFHVRTGEMQVLLFVLCTIPFWTSNVIRMIAWVPLLGRNGLVNQGLVGAGLVDQPVDWLLFSDFSVVLAFVHLFTTFMIVPIFNSMMRIDHSLLEAASDSGATAWQTLWHVIVPLSRTGIIIGSIFVITIVMGDFVTIGVMGGQQIASVGKIIQVQSSYLQFPLAAANAMILLALVLMIIWALTKMVNIRKEL
ncbi:MAG: ABC transporter permease [Rhodoferax sp.]|uniref:ABC transporter permease n=1 Tax=Rhodoferax sp. TaxID=50421 RepID=UPI002734B849|nr:ABC transporter permease [Rhodoferax sp.]MDP2679854.1 ABC transporter permease [Rhodoferax sp.]